MRVIATDLDGTFLTHEKTFNHERFASLLAEWQAAGNAFVIASGRELRWIDQHFEGFTDRLHVVASNGTVRRQLGHAPVAERVDKRVLPALEEIVLHQVPAPSGGFRAYTPDEMFVLRNVGVLDDMTLAMDSLYAAGIQEVDHLAEVEGPVTTLTGKWDVAGSELALQAINGAGLPLFATTSGYGAVDILPAGVNKAATLEKLLADLGATPEDLIAFGDGMNDLEMLNLAGRGYIMPNSDGRLFNRGFDEVDNDSEHEGVLDVMADLLAEEKK
jgi:Cof subfamily protein (haloacid dehalogenase superfamily)